MARRIGLIGAVTLFGTILGGCHLAHPKSSPETRARVGNRNVARAALLAEITPLSHRQVRGDLDLLSRDLAGARENLPESAGLSAKLLALNQHFFGPGGYAAVNDVSGPESVSVASVLENRRGTCVGLAIVYLALAQWLGLDAHAVATPVHLFIRVRIDGKARNVELLEEGRELDDDIYRRRYRIDEASIAAGVFLRDLTNAEVIAHLMSNQAVALSKRGRLDEALARYDAGLRLHPKLVAAWYNRGIDLMNAGRLKEALDSFDRAIELYPSDAQAHNNRGLTKLKLGDRAGAEADFRRALALEPGMKEAEENLKRLISDEGR